MASDKNTSTITTTFHADLSDAHKNEEYWIAYRGKRYPLIEHDKASRDAARQAEPKLSKISDEHLTHYTAEPIPMPADYVVRVHIKHSMNTFKDTPISVGVSHASMYIPPDHNLGIHHHHLDYASTAKTLIYHQPDLMKRDPKVCTIVYTYLDNPPVSNMIDEQIVPIMRQLGPPTPDPSQGWATFVPFKQDIADNKKLVLPDLPWRPQYVVFSRLPKETIALQVKLKALE